MEATKEALAKLLLKDNPWWQGEAKAGLPELRRTAFAELYSRLQEPPGGRAVAVVGMPMVGKTVLLRQTIEALLANGDAAPANILYMTFGYPPLVSVSADEVLATWRKLAPKVGDGPEYLFLDDIHDLRNWGEWLKRQIGAGPPRHIVFTGSAALLAEAGQELGEGSWQELWVSTLSFGEYLQLTGAELPALPQVTDPGALFDWPPAEFLRVASAASPHAARFREYLVRGASPWIAGVENLRLVQSLLRDNTQLLVRGLDIRLGWEMGQLFRYLCMQEGNLLNASAICSNLGVTRPTLQSYLQALEQAHLIHMLPPHGLGEEVLRARYKAYLGVAGLGPAMSFSGGSLSAQELGQAVRAAVFRHLLLHSRSRGERLSYWSKGDRKVDFVLERGGGTAGEKLLPIEVKYRSQGADPRALKGLAAFCVQQGVGRAYVVTRSLEDFGPMALPPRGRRDDPISVMRIPAPLFCYWLGQSL